MDTVRLIIIAILLIFSRTLLFVNIQLFNAGKQTLLMSLMQTDYLKDSALYFTVGVLLSTIKNRPLGALKIISTAKCFCYSMAVFLLYVFLPAETKQYILWLAYPFYIVWFGIGLTTVTFAIIYYKNGILV